MKYFLDTEFIEYPTCIDMISIGIVCEDGREYYAISKDFDESKASQWVKDNVLSKLPKVKSICHSLGPNVRGIHIEYEYPPEYKTRAEIAKEIIEFVSGGKPEFWGYYADYDWVVFCWLFGTMMQLPKGFPRYCRDIKQFCDALGNPKLPAMTGVDHNALDDARHHMKCYQFLTKYEKPV